eukprot:6753488-Ditylum_brightwellii.AAC.1
MPKHPLVTQFGLTCEHFNFIWQHFHVDIAEEEENNTSEVEVNEVEGDDVEEDELVEVGFKRIQQEQIEKQ